MDAERPEALAAFPVINRIVVQWGDQDAFGHVNNTVYFRWFETGRISYLERMGLAEKNSPDNLGPILAAINCNYRRQLRYPDVLLLGSRVTRLGRTSITLDHAIWSTKGEAVAADGQSTIVVFDYAANRPRPVPDRIREAIVELEGRQLPS